MDFRQIDQSPKTFVLVFRTGDELAKGLSQLALRYGGTMSTVTATGVRLARFVEWELKEGLSLVRTIKRTIDPNEIMNPGKKFPLN